MKIHSIRAEILTIGAELLKGSTLNTNAQYLGRKLTALGFFVHRQTACPDTCDAIADGLRQALIRARLVILTGGLGPTPDDLTRQSVAEYFGVPLVFSKSQYLRIKRIYAERGRRVPSSVRIEAMFPQNSVPLINRFGVALGFYIPHGEALVVVLPGVPDELVRMFESGVGGMIQKFFPDLEPGYRFQVNMAGISEPEVMRRLGKDFFDDPCEFGIYPYPGEVAVHIGARKRSTFLRLKRKTRARLTDVIYGWGTAGLSEVVGDLLLRKKRTLAVAESCTGGFLAAELTKVPGCSRYFEGSLTAYQNRLKTSLLGVSPRVLADKGAVSAEVARAMADGVRKLMGSDYGVGVTGIAGPGGGSVRKPVGTVFIAVTSPRKCTVHRAYFRGDRRQIQTRSVKKTLEMLWRVLR
jgi:nicotinamide-nucleotide amidase